MFRSNLRGAFLASRLAPDVAGFNFFCGSFQILQILVKMAFASYWYFLLSFLFSIPWGTVETGLNTQIALLRYHDNVVFLCKAGVLGPRTDKAVRVRLESLAISTHRNEAHGCNLFFQTMHDAATRG